MDKFASFHAFCCAYRLYVFELRKPRLIYPDRLSDHTTTDVNLFQLDITRFQGVRVFTLMKCEFTLIKWAYGSHSLGLRPKIIVP